MQYIDYVNLDYKPRKSDLICEFYVEPAKKETLKRAAGAVASESSVGTWTDVTTMTKKSKKLAAKVYSIDFINKIVKIAYPNELFEQGNMPQILSSIAGNIFGMRIVDKLKLLDIHFPDSILSSFKGPKVGLIDIRKRLNVLDRPLVGTIVKPKVGLNPKQQAQIAFNAWLGGCDIVKDDENLSNMRFNKFRERVDRVLKAKEKAEKLTGEKKMYMPNITAETVEMIRRMKYVKEAGGICVMVDILTLGWAAVQTVRNYNEHFNLILHAHRAGHAALTRNSKHGISMLTIAKCARLVGVDQLHIGTVVGKMHGKAEVPIIDHEIEDSMIAPKTGMTLIRGGHALEQKWHGIKPVFAVCSGGLNPLHIPYLIHHLGRNIIIQMGGGIHGHPKGTFAGARAARQAVEATLEGMSLENYARNHRELAQALKQWG
jgi:ribulose-bisphosphate carboxylase large chain